MLWSADTVRRGGLLVLLAVWILSGCSRSQSPAAVALKAELPAIKVLSGRPDLVSGGEALVEILPPAGVEDSAVKIEAAGRDVTAEFARRPNGRYMALLKDLPEGRSTITAQFSPTLSESLEIVNHPAAGPLFSGAQVQPWPCLEGAQDAQCNRPALIEYWYKPATANVPCVQGQPPNCGNYLRYDPQNPPASADIATTTTDQGKTVPYIMRIETIWQDRGQAMIGVLFNPAQDWQPWAPQEQWNGKLYNVGGANCGMWHGETAAPDVKALAGYAIAKGFIGWSTSLSNNEVHCSPVLHGESLVMAREYIVKHYGPVRYSIGQGQSGGSIKAQQTANEWPGLFDGLSVSLSFPDVWSTLQETYDCGLLLNYWQSPQSWAPGVVWSETQWAATAGHQSISVCAVWRQAFGGILAPNDIGQQCNVPAGEVYDAATTPAGERCALQDYMRSNFGLRPPERWGPVEQQIGHGFANRPLDNVGVQYGLASLMAGQISTAQFIDLNAKIGGYDIDLNIVPERMEADPAALPVVNRGGLINEATHLTIPIIDARAHDLVELHHDYRSYVMRARLDKAHGHHDNHVIWIGPIPLYGVYDPRTGSPLFEIEAFGVIDQWLSAIEADGSELTFEQKVAKNKPAAAHDKCTDAAATELPNDLCPILYPSDASPRIVAGQPFTDDVVKCQLKPLTESDYFPVAFDNAQWAQLQEIFQNGVCDYRKPGVEQQPTIPWISYADGPGGVPLPPLPIPEGWSGPVFRSR